MKNNSLRVALNMTTLSVTEKIRKATAVVDAITNNADVFATPNPNLEDISAAINSLNAAYLSAADGGKSKIITMHDQEREVMKLMRQLAAYVEQVADDDESIVHLSGLDIKKQGVHGSAGFSVTAAGQGQVNLQADVHKGAVYKWQYSVGNDAASPVWINALYTKVSKAAVKGLAAGVYMFRVILIDEAGENPGNTLSIVVR